LLDTKTKKIIGLVEHDVLYNGYPLDVGVFGWAIDPLAAKYPSLSPYAFVGNMPIAAIDPDGKEIFVVVSVKRNGKPKKIIKYDPNKNQQKKKYGDIVNQTFAMLDIVNDAFKEAGSDKFNDLVGSEKKLLLFPEDFNIDNNRRQSTWFYIPPMLDMGIEYGEIGVDPYTGTVIFHVGDSDYKNPVGKHAPIVNFVHELGEAWVNLIGDDNSINKHKSEIYPNWENVIIDYVDKHYGTSNYKNTGENEDIGGQEYKTTGPCDTTKQD